MFKPNKLGLGVGSTISQVGDTVENSSQDRPLIVTPELILPPIDLSRPIKNTYSRSEIFDDDRMIPLSSINYDGEEHESLVDLFQARVFEKKLNNFLVSEIYNKANKEGLTAAVDRVNENIVAQRNRLNVARSLFQTIMTAERSLIDPEHRKQIQSLYNVLNKELGENPLVAIPDDVEIDVFESIADISGIPAETLKAMKNSQLFFQVTTELRSYFWEGGCGGLFSIEGTRPNLTSFQIDIGNVDIHYDTYKEITGRKSLHHIGLAKTNTNTDMVMTNNPFARIPGRRNEPTLRRVAQICSQLATEFRLSAGLGRVAGSSLAAKFGVNPAKPAPFTNFVRGKGSRNVKKDTTTKNSLADYAVVSSDGNMRQSSKVANVALFDSYVPGSVETNYVDAKTAFFDTVKDNPRNNNMEAFDDIIMQAVSRFSDGEELMKLSTCSDLDLNLLSPQGLFIKVLEEFLNFVTFLSKEPNNDELIKKVTVAHQLYISSFSANDTATDTYAMQMKRRLNMLAMRILSTRRESNGVQIERQVRMSAFETGDWFKNNVADTTYDRRVLAQLLFAFSSDTSSVMPLSDLSHAHADVFMQAFKAEKNSGSDKVFQNAIKASGIDILEATLNSDGTEGPLHHVIDIFEALEQEAMEAADSDDASYVNLNRLTNNAGFDASLSVAMLLECFSLLAKSFLKTRFYAGAQSNMTVEGGGVDNDLAFWAGEGADGYGDPLSLTNRGFSDILYALRTSALISKKASNHLHGATVSDELAVAFELTDTGSKLAAAQNNISVEGGLIESNSASQLAMKFQGFAGVKEGDDVELLKVIAQPNFMQQVLTGIRSTLDEMFTGANHILMFEGGSNKQSDYGRKALLEIIEAAKGGDLDVLFEDPNDKVSTFLPVGGSQHFNESTAQFDDFFTPAEVLEEINNLAICGAAPMRLFNVCHAMVKNLSKATEDLSSKAAALRAGKASNIVRRGVRVAEPTDEEKALVSLASTRNGRDLLKLASKRQLEIIDQRLLNLEDVDEDDGFVVNNIPDELITAIDIYLDSLQDSEKRGKFVFFGLPAGKLENLINNKNAEKIEESGFDAENFTSIVDDSLENSAINIKVIIRDEMLPDLKYKPLLDAKFPLGIEITDRGIITAFTSDQTPTTIEELTRFAEFTIDSPLTIEKQDIKGDDLIPKYSVAELRLVLESHLIKKMASLVFDQNLSEVDMVKNNSESRDRRSSERKLMTNLAATIGVTPEELAKLYGNQKSLDDPSRNRVIAFRRLTRSRAKTDLLFSLFNTKPFYADAIQSVIGMPSLFDYVFAVFIDQSKLIPNSSATINDDTTVDEYTALSLKNTMANVINKKESFHLKSAFCDATLVKRK